MRKFSNRAWVVAGMFSLAVAVAGCRSPGSCESCGESAGTPSTCEVKVGPSTKSAQSAMTPDAALAELRAGNARFISGHPLPRDPLAELKAAAPGQYPFAIVLSCIDSRQPVEMVLDQGIGNIFSARVAGNVLNEDILGSMEFACRASGAKLIAVIGHSNCGAIKGAIDEVQLGNLTGLLARIKPAIDKVSTDNESHNWKDPAFVASVAEANVRLVMQEIPEHSPVLRELLDQGKIKIVGGMYDLATGKVEFYDK